ncbi:MAG: hypothetical protein LBE09_01365 [Christensenellaceae bacterium]|nr:hypothetical protein [Christensenellaceae bacterium]
MQLVAKVSPEHTTYPEVCFAIVEGGTLATITSGGLLKINQDADVGAIIKIIARTTLDTALSAEYSVTVLKVPVEYVYISAGGITTLRPGETIQFTKEVSENATYGTVTYSLIEGSEHATITASGLFAVNNIVGARFATVKVIGNADGVISNIYEIEIYNPAQSVAVLSDKTVVLRGETFALNSVVNEFATSRDVAFLISSGSQFVTALGGGVYLVNDDISVPNAQITLRGYIDEIYSEAVTISVYIQVASIAITDYVTIVEPNTDTWLYSVVTPSFATNTSATYFLTNPIDGVAIDAKNGMLSVSAEVAHNTQIYIYAVSADGNVSETVTITVKVASITISAADTVVRQSDYVRIYENFEYFSFENVRYVVTPISHSALNFASITVIGVAEPKAYLSIADEVTVRNYTFSIQAFGDELSSNVLYFTVYIPVTRAVLSADNYTPTSTANAGGTIVLSVETNETATNQDREYQIISGSEYVESIESDILIVKTCITVSNAEIVIGAVIDGYTCDYITLSVKVPVTQVVLGVADGYTEEHESEQGSWLKLSAIAYPLYATDRHIVYSIAFGSEYASVDQNGFVTVYQNALVGAEIQIIAIADFVSSVPYAITVLKVPVTSLIIEPVIAEDLRPSERVQFLGTVNCGNYATYCEIKYYVESSQYATVTENGMLSVNEVVNDRFAKILIYGIADGYRSESYEISIYNPATIATLTADKTANVRPGEIVNFIAAVNEYATVQAVQYIVSSENYLICLGDGKYQVKAHSDIRLPNASFTIYAHHQDGIDSNQLLFNIIIDVENVVLENVDSPVVQGSTVNLIGRITPDYATGASIVYALRSSVPGITLNSETGEIAVAGTAPLGVTITAYAKAIVDGVVVFESSNVVYAVAPVAVTSVTLNVPSDMTLGAGAQISLVSMVLPSIAATKDYNAVAYFVSDTGLVSIADGMLTMLPFTEEFVGQTVTFYASAGGCMSQTYRITLAHTSVSEVTLTTQNNVTTVEPGGIVQFYASISPNTATIQTSALSIISGASFGYLDGDVLKVNATAKHNSKIVVQVVADDKTANYEITVRVASISVAATKTTLMQGEQIQITGINSALFTKITYASSGHATVSTSGLVIVNPTVTVRNATFTVIVTADDLPSKRLAFTIYIPVDTSQMVVKTNGMSENTEAKLGTRITLSTVVNTNATNQTATYSVVSGGGYGTLSGSTFTLNSTTADYNPKVALKATINDNGTVREKTVVVKIIVPVTGVTLNCSDSEINPNKEYVVTATVLPANATYKDVMFTLPSSVNLVNSTTSSVTFKVKSDVANGTATIKATSTDYMVNGATYAGTVVARDLIVKRILATALTISSVKIASGTVIDNTNANKARPDDTLTPVVSIAPADVSSGAYTLSLSGTNYAYVSGKNIIVRDISYMTSDNPSFTITATATDGSGKTASCEVAVYVPVVSITKSVPAANRNSTTSLGVSYNVAQNGGYATAKTFKGTVASVTNASVSISNASAYYFNGLNLVVPKNAPGGTVINIKLTSNDDASKYCIGSVVVNALSLTASNIYYNTNTTSYSSYSIDSDGRTMYATDNAQLSEGKYTYLLGKYNSELLSAWGVTFTATETSSYATIDSNKKLSITANAPGSEIVTVTIDFIDGTKTTTIVKTVKVFNAVNDANITTATVTSQASYLYASSNDSQASSSSNSYDFSAVDNSNYSLSSAGYLVIRNKIVNHTDLYVLLRYYQYYNGVKLTIWTKSKPVKINIKNSNIVVFHENKDDATITDDKIYFDDLESIGLTLSTLINLGYTTLKFSISVDMREINDGYQELYLYAVASSGNTVKLWEKTNIEHSSENWGTRTYTYTVALSSFYSSYGNYVWLCLGYSAHGAFEDSWVRGKSSVTITAS